ncbi:hypothetical protein KIP69_04740 [Geobacter sulfurreducens]|jgi:hypothetical protein|uniref:Uncharacterized protein n=1 Tax=Geobacter sulfurreducens (strain ATCC 51573 / DSM 12127 / PCA) TaxID=243231 RepID=I7F9H4_GEOSL|nr:hypothetical protein [Geobacter sulfurreducens]ADI83768.1 hypothetical protein KN400_0905 [Geobacter sulfurreducens KN400]AFP20424.1 hypothetical protein GSU3520 [Geobacter sulfurreducens PCA]AJY70660.1 hypothetical protein RW64_14265 [Geobacter sulfurreducens]QVW36165.1 hypothetical protein KIP69_04740 [Geobacter sulfurreducens]UAC04978.1 hypothetical protein KVP06_04650 [Geobacter sulfurreducens]
MMLLSGALSFPILDDAGTPVIIALFCMDDFLLAFFAFIGIAAVLIQFMPVALLLVSMVRSLFRCSCVSVISLTTLHDV